MKQRQLPCSNRGRPGQIGKSEPGLEGLLLTCIRQSDDLERCKASLISFSDGKLPAPDVKQMWSDVSEHRPSKGRCRRGLAFVALLGAFFSLAPPAHAQLTLDNTATVTGTPTAGTLPSASATENVDLEDAAPSLSVNKTASVADTDGSGTTNLGDVVTYTFAVENTGNVTLSDIEITDPLLGGLIGTIASLAPGATDNSVTSTYTITQTDVDTGNITNQATGTGDSPTNGPDDVTDLSDDDNGATDGPDADTDPNNDPTITPITSAPSLSIVKAPPGNADEDTSGSITLGDTLTYTITATNTGNITQNNVIVSDALLTPDNFTCTTLAPGATCVLTGTYQVVLADAVARQVQNTASVQSNEVTTPQTDGPIVTPVIWVINAVDDSIEAIDGTPGATNVINVLANDTANGGAVNAGDVTLTTVTPDPEGALTLNPDGSVDVAAGTPEGTYTLTYQICDSTSPTNCDTAIISIGVKTPASISGTVFSDDNSNGVYDEEADQSQENYVVELVQNGNIIATQITQADGSYLLENIDPASDLVIIFSNPAGIVIGVISDIDLSPGEKLEDQNMSISPTGKIYDSQSRQPIAGAVVSVLVASGANNGAGSLGAGGGNSLGVAMAANMLSEVDATLLPAVCFADPNQQGQTTGDDGSYRIDIIPGNDPLCPVSETQYFISVDPPSGYSSSISIALPNEAGALEVSNCPIDVTPGGFCQVGQDGNIPTPGIPAVYYLSFQLQAGDQKIVFNHIAIDPLVALTPITLAKTAGVATAVRGASIEYSIQAINTTPDPVGPISVFDLPPPGFIYLEGTATVDGVKVDPVVEGIQITFENITVPGDGVVEFKYVARVAPTVLPGRHINRVNANDSNGRAIAVESRATVEIIPEAVFDCGDIIGRVFDDANGNGYHDPGEVGLPGVRVSTVRGELITTDQHGRFSVPCAELPKREGTNFIMKLDTRTLPTGYKLTTENPRVVRLTAGKITKLNFGAAIALRKLRFDLPEIAFTPGTSELTEQAIGQINGLLLSRLSEEPFILQLRYKTRDGEDIALVRQRLKAASNYIDRIWKRRSGTYDLVIETTILR